MWTRRNVLRMALALPAGGWMARYEAMAAPARGAIKITSVKALQLDFQGDGCLVRIETDAGITGYGETGVDARMARARIPQLRLIGADPLSIERHFQSMTGMIHPFLPPIPLISGIDIALWDLAGKILGAGLQTDGRAAAEHRSDVLPRRLPERHEQSGVLPRVGANDQGAAGGFLGLQDRAEPGPAQPDRGAGGDHGATETDLARIRQRARGRGRRDRYRGPLPQPVGHAQRHSDLAGHREHQSAVHRRPAQQRGILRGMDGHQARHAEPRS